MKKTFIDDEYEEYEEYFTEEDLEETAKSYKNIVFVKRGKRRFNDDHLWNKTSNKGE